MPLTQPTPYAAIYRIVEREDETASQYLAGPREDRARNFEGSEFWRSWLAVVAARQKIDDLKDFARGDLRGDPIGQPNGATRDLAGLVLVLLELASRPPDRVVPLDEGGIAMSLVSGAKRAQIEIYNSGEAVAATYSHGYGPEVWEFDYSRDSVQGAIQRICVYLSA
jgi:hypothetical protein